MKTKSLIYSIAAIVITCSLTLSSCKKKKENEEPVVDKEQGTSTDNTLAETMLNDIQSMAGQGSENGDLTTYKGNAAEAISSSSCATITFGTKTFTVDFGTVPCKCYDGRYRSGKLMFDYTGSTSTITPIYYRTPGFKCVITSDNYVVDTYTVNIVNKTITNTTPAGFNPTTTNLTWSISASVNIIKPNGGGTVSWSGSRTKALLNTNDGSVYNPAGTTPIDWTKAIIQLNGSASGTTAGGENFTSSITNLVRDMNCTPNPTLQPKRHPFISGQMVFTPGTRPTRTIDFGSGTCDLSATLTINGVTYSFTLP